MPIIVDATYENGVLVPARPLELAEHERVRVTVDRPKDPSGRRPGWDYRISIDPEASKQIMAMEPYEDQD